MNRIEEEYLRQTAREDELYRRQLAAIARRKAHRRKITALVAVLALFIGATAAAVVLSRRAGGPGGRREKDGDDPSLTDKTDPGEAEIPEWITQDLLPLNEYSRPGTPLTEVKGVVVHYVGNPGTTAKQNRNYFANLAKTHETSASSHFVVGLEGEIIQCVPLDEWSYCSSSANSYSIAIEVCHPDETGKFNDETVESLVKLLKWLCQLYDLDREDVIRHYDVTGKICPKYYVDNPEEWESLLDLVFERSGLPGSLGDLFKK